MQFKKNRSLYAQARHFARVSKYLVNAGTISKELNRRGYIVREYDTEKPDVILIEKALVKHSEGIRGFTYRKMDEKIVFIKASLSTEEKLYTLLHELGHIILEHFDNQNAKDARLLELEAEAFVYTVLQARDNHYKYAFITSVACGIVLFASGVIAQFIGLM